MQQIAREHAEAGYQVLILGDRNHPEVMAIVGWTGDTAIVFISLDELKALSLAGKKICLVSQTTEKLERFESAVAYLQSLELEELVIHNTICAATRDRQSDASDLAREVDLMVVIGGYNSANTCKLVSICQDAGVMTKHVESAADLEDEWFRGIEKIGLTAGASTPDWIIREVIDKMEELTMEQGLEQGYGTLEPLNLYDVVTGTVVKINPDEVMVDVANPKALFQSRSCPSKKIQMSKTSLKLAMKFRLWSLRWKTTKVTWFSPRSVLIRKKLWMNFSRNLKTAKSSKRRLLAMSKAALS